MGRGRLRRRCSVCGNEADELVPVFDARFSSYRWDCPRCLPPGELPTADAVVAEAEAIIRRRAFENDFTHDYDTYLDT